MRRRLRFGRFELDVDAFALSHVGQPVRLERTPMALLIMLAENSGALVEREAIRAALWPQGVHVEADAAINTAMRKIRRALRGDAGDPPFVETVIGKGYRFVAPVEAVTFGGAAVGPADEAFLRARHRLEKRSEPDLLQATALFREALDLDPTHAAAYVGLAETYAQLGYGSFAAPDESFPLARAAAERALAINQSLGEAHAALGFSRMYYEWNFAGAEASYQRAIALSARSAVAHQWYAYLLTAMERPLEDAEREIALAKSLDPLSVPIYTDHAYILHYYGRNDAALKAVHAALAMNPAFPPAYFWLGRIYTAQRRYAEAEEALRKIGPLRAWTPAMAQLGFLYATTERRCEAEAILTEFDEMSRAGRYASSYAVAVVYAGLRDRERALECLEQAFRERSHWLVWLNRDPRWDGVRSDPRFTALVRSVGLPDRMAGDSVHVKGAREHD